MSSRHEIACAAADALRNALPNALPAVLGFDGFIDDIFRVVETRHSHQRFDPLQSMESFGKKITAAAGQSANMELVLQQRKLGGNGPIMGHALAMLGLPVTYIGAVGDEAGAIHPVFRDFAARARLIPLSPPAHTSALEFDDGKVMLGNLRPLLDISWERLIEAVGLHRLTEMIGSAALIGLLNWTMLPHLTEIWRRTAREILPQIPPTPPTKPRRIFVDLADPRKRSSSDLSDAMDALRELQKHAAVTLGLNLAEAQQVSRACGLKEAATASDIETLTHAAAALRETLAIDTVVIHPRHGAAAATTAATAGFHGPFVKNPIISTGAGDHFNAGFALGQLLQLDLPHALCLGTAVSGYYVRMATSPTLSDLATFLRDLPEPAPTS